LKKRSAIVAKNANEAAKNAKSDAAAVTKIVHDADKDAPGQAQGCDFFWATWSKRNWPNSKMEMSDHLMTAV
jgi:hypothetical protein